MVSLLNPKDSFEREEGHVTSVTLSILLSINCSILGVPQLKKAQGGIAVIPLESSIMSWSALFVH